MKIALDYGHCLSGLDTGALGNGYKEQECTREIGKLVKAKLEALGHTVVAVAPDSASSVSSSLSTRVNNCPSDASLFVSIHLNAGGGVGTEIYTYGAKELASARSILNNIVSLGFTNRGIKDGSKLYVVKAPSCNSMLIEVCFIDTYSDMIKYEANKENLAEAIASGIANTSFSPVRVSYKTEYKNEWKFIDGEWYSFDSQGYARKDTWLQDGGKWYYLKYSCKMAKSEWLWINGECYCFNASGALYISCTTPDNYEVDETGAWIK